MKTLNLGLLQGLLGNPNMGCNALLYSAVQLLQQAAKAISLPFQITSFSAVSPDDLELYPGIQGIRIACARPFMGLRHVMSDYVRHRGASHLQMRQAFAACQVFFEIAGGDSFSDIYGIERLRDAHKTHRKVRQLGKPLVFLPQTIGPFVSAEAQHIARDSLGGAHLVFVRDPLSYKEAAKYVSSSKVKQTLDMACFMEYDRSLPDESSRQRIGINPSGLLWHGGYTRDNQFGLVEDYKKVLRAILGMLQESHCRPVLVPHVLCGPGFDIEDDYRICRQLGTEFPHATIAPYFYTPMEAKTFISGLDLLVGSRMHACIAAYTSGVPVFPLVYSRKFTGLFRDALNWSHGADLRVDREDTIIRKLRGCLGVLSELSASMPARVNEVTGYKESLVSSLGHLLQDIAKSKEPGETF